VGVKVIAARLPRPARRGCCKIGRMKKDFDILEFMWRTGLLLFLGGCSVLNLGSGIIGGDGGEIFVGLVFGVPAFFVLLSWLDRFWKK
jgi:hypothetical protein